MDPSEEIDKWFAEIENPAPDVRIGFAEFGFAECGWCRGKEPESKIDNGSTDEVTEHWIWVRSMTPRTTHSYRVGHQLIHKKHGFTIEMHDCVELGGWALKVVGPLPETKEKRQALDAFMKYAWSVAEKRGPKAQATAEEIIECLRQLPKNARSLTRVAAEMDLPPRTIQHTLKVAGLTFRQAKQKAQE